MPRDATGGAILRLALPLALSLAVSSAVPLVNLLQVARAGPDVLYLRSLYTPVSLLLLAVADAFAIGAQVAVAVLAGRKSTDIERVVGSFVLLAACAGAALALVS